MENPETATQPLLAADVSVPSSRAEMWRKFRRQPLALGSLGFLIVLCLVAIFADLLAPHDPSHANFERAFAGPSGEFWLGTDHLGRDVASRLIEATQVAMLAGLEAIAVAVVLGVPVGLASGYFGGWLDRVLMRLVDVLLSLPGMLVALAIIAVLGPGLVNAMLAVGIIFAFRIARLVRGVVLSVREELYVDAARLSGAPSGRILTHYLLPNVMIPLMVEVALYFGIALLIEAMLSFLGVGVQPPQATWGVMLAEARRYVAQEPLLAVPPGLLITLTVVAVNLLTDGLTSAMNPRATGTAKRRGPAAAQAVPVDVAADEPQALLDIRGLHVELSGAYGSTPVLRGVDLAVRQGEIVGLVGESGSGKSLTSLAVMGLLPAGARVTGSIRCDGQQLVGASDRVWRDVRGKRMAMVFQDPGRSLNPALTIGRQIVETLTLHRGLGRADARAEAVHLLERVGVPNAETRLKDYPHQFSGGMAQRVMIAIALACEPDVLIADEPTTALDVTTQARVLDLLLDLRRDEGFGILFITHDLGVVADICDRAVVMYAGQVVESATVEDLFARPNHPYTKALLATTPDDGDDQGPLPVIPGQVPRLDQVGPGCAFASRCSSVEERCRTTPPGLIQLDAHSSARCLLISDGHGPLIDGEVAR